LVMAWVDRLLQGDAFAAAKVISLLEAQSPEIPEIMRRIHSSTGSASIVGITGPPGVGKSTLVDQLIALASADELRVGVLAVDASSPFTGGALLGDRVRFGDHASRDNVFVRSMGTRGRLGGLSDASRGAVRILDAFGCDLILIETVGVGQIELDIAKEADTVVVVTMPSTGDEVQTMKAGIMEIADLYVVNKADISGAELVCMEINKVLDIIRHDDPWRPPVIMTCAQRCEGVADLWQAVQSHRKFLLQDGRMALRRKAQIKSEITALVLKSLTDTFWGPLCNGKQVAEMVDSVYSRETDIYAARDRIMHTMVARMQAPQALGVASVPLLSNSNHRKDG